jgi:hypothetical protein
MSVCNNDNDVDVLENNKNIRFFENYEYPNDLAN